jgi:hypothetical protein
MKPIKKNKSFRKEYGPVVVWLDDINKLVEVMGGKADISTNDYQFESIEDLKTHYGPGPFKALKISSSKPSAYVEFSRMSVSCYVFPSPTAAQTFHEIDDVLKKCQRRPLFIYRFWFAVVATIPLLLLWGLDEKYKDTTLLAIASTILPLAVLWGLVNTIRGQAAITLKHRHEARTFLERNRDQLLLLLIGAIVGGLFTFAGTVMKERFYPASPTVIAPKQK